MEDLRAVMADEALTASYGGYAFCPLTTARNKMLLADFDYTRQPTPSIPLIDTTKERKEHLAAQEVRPAGAVLEPHAQGPRPTSSACR